MRLIVAGAAMMVINACGNTENFYSAAVVPVTPVSLHTPCLPPVTPSPGHEVFGHTYLVWTNDCERVQRVTQWQDSALPGPDWPTPRAECVRVQDVTPLPCG